MLTTLEIINIAKISQYLATADITKKGLFGGGVDLLLPNKLYTIRKNIEYIYDLDPTNDYLVETGNYLLALCGWYGVAAQNVTGSGGSVATITPTHIPTQLDFVVSSSSIIVTGATTADLTAYGYRGFDIQLFRNNVIQSVNYRGFGETYYSWNKTSAILTFLGTGAALVVDDLIQINPVI